MIGAVLVTALMAACGAPVLQESSRDLFVDSGLNLGDSRSFQTVRGDLDGDADEDLVFVDFLGSGHVWSNDGAGGFVDSGQALGGAGGHGAAHGDLDCDGDLDLDAHVTLYKRPGTLWINDGIGQLTDSGRNLDGNAASVAFGDVGGDGDLDAILGRREGRGGNRVLLNQGSSAGKGMLP